MPNPKPSKPSAKVLKKTPSTKPSKVTTSPKGLKNTKYKV